MAACGISAVSCPMGRSLSLSSASTCRRGRGRPLAEMQRGVDAHCTSGSKSSFAARVSSGAMGRRIHGGRGEAGRAFARQGVESAMEDMGLLYPKDSSASSPRELEIVQNQRWSGAARDEFATLNDDGGRLAREALNNGGEITEANMDRLVDVLLREEGQSDQDYRRRTIFFNLIAELLDEGRVGSAGKDVSKTSVQILVDSILAEDGRSATDYHARAQVFAKSAEVFPFNAEVGPI